MLRLKIVTGHFQIMDIYGPEEGKKEETRILRWTSKIILKS